MTDEEVEVVAEELAKIINVPWSPGYEKSPFGRVVSEGQRAEARVIIAALERIRPNRDCSPCDPPQSHQPKAMGGWGISGDVRPGVTVIYRPSGEQRADPYRIVEIQGDRAYLAPILRTCVGWVSIERLQAAREEVVPER
jgi:hypothetical protein